MIEAATLDYVRIKLIVGVGLLVAAAGVFTYYNPAAAKTVAGQGNGCDLPNALSIEKHKRELTAAKDRILYASKLVQVDEERGFELYETPYGRFWTEKGERYILPFNLAEQETHFYGSGAQYVQKGDIVLDCGANVGTFARFALNAGAAKVVAIEISPDNIELLRRNFQKEIAEGRLIVYPKGVWNKEDTLELMIDPDNRAADSVVIQRDSAKVKVQVPLTTIDKLVDELKLERVDFVKMDIEGAEVNALKGAQATIAKYKPRMSLSSYHVPTDPVEIPKAVRSAWPGVKINCGPCAFVNGKVRPDVLYFHQ